MSVLSWLKSATLTATVIATGSLLVPAPVEAQEVTVLRGSPSRPPQSYSSIDCSNPYYAQYCQNTQSSDYSPSSYGDDYPYYGDDFPVGVGGIGRGFHRGGFHRGDFFHRGFHGGFHRADFSHRGFHGGFHGGGFHAGGFRGGFHGGGFHGGGFSGGGFHGGGGHR